jgi:hypothetical protein
MEKIMKHSTQLVDDNFDLEQQILKCWGMVDDVKEIVDQFNQGKLNNEDTVQTLLACVAVYQFRFDRTFQKYEEVCRGLHSLRHQIQNLEGKIEDRAEKSSKKSGKKSAQNVAKNG